MKPSNFFIAVIATISLGTTSSTISAQRVTGEATTTFEANKSIQQPKDPEDDKELVPTYPPTQGPLSINYASSIRFGKQTITGDEGIFYAQPDKLIKTETGDTRESPNFVQVTDLRGTGTGWTLSVRQNGPLKKANGTTISGAKLIISTLNLTSQAGEQDSVTEMSEQVLDETGSNQRIITVPPKRGMGTWNVFLGSANDPTKAVKLIVPKNQPKEGGSYTTSLTWTLEDVL